jgi:hypothetical protein
MSAFPYVPSVTKILYSLLMHLLKNLLKAMLLVALIFGVLYFGLSYYFKHQADKGVTAVVTPSKNTEELTLLHEELSILEQKIQDLRRENKPYADEQEAVDNIKSSISRFKGQVAAELPAVALDAGETKKSLPPTEGWLSDPYQRAVLLAIAALLALLVLLLIVRGLRRRAAPKIGVERNSERVAFASKPRPLSPGAVAREADGNASGEVRLKETLELFKTASAVIQKGETRQVPLEALRPPPEGPLAKPPPRSEPRPSEKTPLPSPQGDGTDLSLIEHVFDLSHEGLSIEEISGKLHVDQDQVRLILRFKR